MHRPRARASRPKEALNHALLPSRHRGRAVPNAVNTVEARTNMRWIPGGTFLMGSETFYPEERPVHRVEVDGFWMDEHPVTAAEFRRFVRETDYVTCAEQPLDPAEYPGADPELLVPGRSSFEDRRPGRPARLAQLVGVRSGGVLEEAAGAGNHDQRPRPAPRGARRIRGRGGLRCLGRQGAADRGRVGVRRARRARGRDLRLGRRALPRRKA